MGKRELVLIAVFVLVGAVLYQVTAPTPRAGEAEFSLSALFRKARSTVGDRPASRTVQRSTTRDLPGEVTVIRLEDVEGRVSVVGTDGATLEVTAEVMLRGLDEADLDQQDTAMDLRVDLAGPQVTLAVAHGDSHPGEQTLTLRVPRRLQVRLSGRGVADVRDVAGLDIDRYRGDLVVEGVQGPISGTHREGRAEFGVGSAVDIETARSTLRVVQPVSLVLRAEATDVEVTDATGPVTIDQQRCTLEVVGGDGPITVRGSGGTIKLRGIQSPVDIEAERLTVSMTMARAVTTRLVVDADDVDLTLPGDGLALTAEVERGELRAPADLPVTTDGTTRRASGPVHGGGPTVDLRVTRGSLTIRTR